MTQLHIPKGVVSRPVKRGLLYSLSWEYFKLTFQFSKTYRFVDELLQFGVTNNLRSVSKRIANIAYKGYAPKVQTLDLIWCNQWFRVFPRGGYNTWVVYLA